MILENDFIKLRTNFPRIGNWGLSVESKKKRFFAKMVKKNQIQALSPHFIFNQFYKIYA